VTPVTDYAHPKVRVFVLDDHAVVLAGVRTIIEAEPDLVVVGEASTAEEALARIACAPPDVAIVDLQLGQDDGIEVCRELRARHPEVRCLVLTAFSDRRDVIQAVMAGAAGYLLKQRTTADLVDAIRKVARGEVLDLPGITEEMLDRVRRHGAPDALLERLSPRDRRILALLADGRSNRQIADELFLSEKTVKNYVSRLLAKLGMARRTEAAVYGARLSDYGELDSGG
jgi:two-component system response regulator DevR